MYFYASFHKRNGRNDVSNRCCDYRRNRDRGNEQMSTHAVAGERRALKFHLLGSNDVNDELENIESIGWNCTFERRRRLISISRVNSLFINLRYATWMDGQKLRTLSSIVPRRIPPCGSSGSIL